MIADVLSDLGIRFARHGEARAVRPGWIGVRCPFCGHGPDDAYLGFPLDGAKLAACWSCGNHLLGDTLAALTGCTVKDAIDLLERYGVWGAVAASRIASGCGIYREPAGVHDKPSEAHTAYLEKRRIDRTEAEYLWGMKYIGPYHGRLSWRLFLPVQYHGRNVSWTTRHVGTNPARYVSAEPTDEAVRHKELLYGHDLCRHSVVVVEGPIDAVSVGPGAVATFGTGVTAAQLAKLAAFPVRAICFDNEEAAQARAREWARALEPFPGVTEVVRLESANDWNEADPAEVAELRRRYLRD